MDNIPMNNPNAGKVVMFTNISDKDFTHAFGGQPFFVKAGETVPFPYDLGMHLATHLSRRMFLDGDTSPKNYDPSRPDPTQGIGRPLWNETTEREMIDKILGTQYQEELAAPKSEMQILQEQVAALNAKFGGTKDEVLPPVITPEVEASGSYKDKAQVIAELTKKGVAFNPRLGKDKLIELLESSDEAV